MEQSRIRVLHVLWTSQFGGITMGVRDLLNAIDPARCETGVCVLADGNFDLAASLPRHVRVERLHFRNGCDVRSAWRFCRLLRRTGCDIVHSHTPSALVALALAISLPRTPRIFHEHGAVLERRRSWRNRLSYACVARHYDRFIAVSPRLVEPLAEARIAKTRIRVIENAIDLRAGGDERTPAEARGYLGLQTDGVVVGTACRLAPEKDLGLFLEVARRVRASRHDVRFIIAGGGPIAAELTRRAAESGLGDAVSFLGFRTDMPVVWRAMDVFLFTSATEAFGRTLLEAQASMIPVVATRQVDGGAAGLVAASPGALSVGSRDPGELAERVLRLLASRPLRENMGRAGRDWVRQRFGVGPWAARMQALYDELCKDSTRLR